MQFVKAHNAHQEGKSMEYIEGKKKKKRIQGKKGNHCRIEGVIKGASPRLEVGLAPLNGFAFDLFQASVEFGPVLHDDLGTKLRQLGGHFGTLVVTVVASNIGNDGNAGADGAESTGAAVFDGNTFVGFLVQDFQRMQVNGRVWLGGGLGKRGGGAEDVVWLEVLVLANLLDGGTDAAQSRGRDNSHVVFSRALQSLEFFGDANAGRGLGLQLGDDLVFLFLDVALNLLLGHFEAVLALQRDHHAAEVLADEILDELLASVAVGNVALGEDLVGNVGAGLESQLLGHDEGVVTIEQELSNLRGGLVTS